MAQDVKANNKRIAKNTILLYIRMILVMGMNLYTSRIILNALGINDFGVYGVVGGLVAMFSIISGSMSTAIARFLTFELGREKAGRLKETFGVALSVQTGLALLIIILSLTAGMWFLNHRMEIPPGSLHAANWVLVLSTLTLTVNLISVPYNAVLIAHERMGVFAYVSIVEVLLKLGAAFLLLLFASERLIIYASAIFCVSLLIRLIYGVYCDRHFPECRTRPLLEKEILKEISGFAGWNFIGSASSILRNQGNNVILNLFFNTAVNAAYGICMQVNSAVMQLADNFMTSVNPQITKYYAQGEYEEMNKLMERSARLSFYLTLLIASVILLNTPYILRLWLKEVPVYAPVFVQLVMVFALTESISKPLITGMLASGNIRNYQLVVGGLQMLNLPLSYLALRMGNGPTYPLTISIAISICCLAARLIMLGGIIPFEGGKFLRGVCLKALLVGIIVLAVPHLLKSTRNADMGFLRFLLESVANLAWCCAVVYVIGCNRQEKHFIAQAVGKTAGKIFK